MKNLLSVRMVVIVVLGIVVIGMISAFAAANVVPETGAGQGAGTISGYTVTNVTYGLNTDPTVVDSVSFDLAATSGAGTPTTVKVRVVTTGNWYTCTAGTPPAWSCDVSADSIQVSTMDELNVVAAE